MRVLDADLLSELEDCWRRAGATYVDRMAPGLTDSGIDHLVAGLGFELPEEVRRWYRWHDGSNDYYVTNCRVMTPLADDVESTMMFRENLQDWVAGWLRAMNEQPLIAFDCRGAMNDPVPVWHYGLGFDMPTRPVFPSIGEMVGYWIKLIESGAMAWTEGAWQLTEPTAIEVLEHLGGIASD